MILEEKHSDGTIFIYEDGRCWLYHETRFPTKDLLALFNIAPQHQECYQRLVKRVERQKKLERLLS